MNDESIQDGTTTSDETTPSTENPETAAPQEETVPSESASASENAEVEETTSGSTVNVAVQPNGVSVTTHSTDIPEEDSREGLAGAVESLLGQYTPRTETVTTYAPDGTMLSQDVQVVPGVAGVDALWLGGLLLFTVMLYGLLRLIGAVIKW